MAEKLSQMGSIESVVASFFVELGTDPTKNEATTLSILPIPMFFDQTGNTG
jgi:hypothetical protein